MIEYKCPYCGQDSYKVTRGNFKKGKFLNWKSVRSHTSKCDKNTKEFLICDFYGPIPFSTINQYESIDHFKREYPNISFTAHVWRGLRNAGKISLRKVKYSDEECISAIKDFVSTNNRIPYSDEFNIGNLPQYPSAGTIAKHFGGWNKAIEAAGYKPSERVPFGFPTVAKDNKLYKSRAEAYFVDNFLFEKYQYEYEKPYGNGWLFDFYLPQLDLHIELDGEFTDIIYRNKMNDKILFCNSNNINLRVIKRHDIYKRDFVI